MNAAAGDVIDGRYTLVERVDDWGLGEAWRADDARFADRPVVIKLLPPGEGALTAVVLQRLDAVRALRHPHVLPLVDHGAWRGREYVVHEHGPLRSVGAWLDAQRTEGALAPIDTVRAIIDHVCQALSAAHAESPPVLHEGLAPASVMLREGDAGVRARLIDFTLAPFADPIVAPGSAREVACMAPEQFQGEVADARTDAFAVGLFCFELLAALPDPAGPADGYRGRGDVPEAVWRTLQASLATERDARYPNVDALREALDAAWNTAPAPAVAAPDAPAPDAPAPAAEASLRYQMDAAALPSEHVAPLSSPVRISEEVSPRGIYQLPELPEAPTMSFDAAAVFAGFNAESMRDTLTTMRSNRDPRALMEMTRRYRMQAASAPMPAPAPAPAPALPPPAPPARAPAPPPPARAPAPPSQGRRVVFAVLAMLLTFGAVFGAVWLLFRARHR